MRLRKRQSERPERPDPESTGFTCFVSMTDSFMSGWGKAEGLTNRLIFGCKSEAEAKHIQEHAETRGDMTRIYISTEFPRLKSRGYYYQLKDRETMPAWYAERRDSNG